VNTPVRPPPPAVAPGAPVPAPSGLRRFFLGAGLPVFLLAALAVYEAALLGLLFAPPGAGWLGAWREEFKIWCFNYDPRTGGMEWAAVGMMLLEPLFVVTVAAAFASVAAVGGTGADDAPPPFPGERIRTRLPAPGFHLTDQTGRDCALEELRGRIVLVTGVYALCSTTCPEILIETRRLLDSLPAAVPRPGQRGRLVA
jgi:protein SCO1/2